MSLSPAQIADFRRDGFLHLPGAVPGEQVESAVHAINYNIGQGIPADALQTWRSQSFFPELSRQPAITDLFNASGLRQTVQNLMGQSNVAPAGSGQLALRFPGAPDAPLSPLRGHVDGIHTPDNGVPQGTLASFSALLGVFLTDVPGENAGNFTVWPGSHLKMQNYFRAHGTEIILQENKIPPIERGAPQQLCVRAGDAVLAHYQLLHGAAGNGAPRPRYAVFFRIKHPDHEAHKPECLTDVWREWPGIA